MSKCRITVLLYSVEQEKTCFNPLIVVNDNQTIADLVKKALELYTKKAKLPKHELEIITLHTVNAGVSSTIADEDDLVSDILGERATLTVVVKDAVNLIERLAGPSIQLLTPVPSKSPSIDLNALHNRLLTPQHVHDEMPTKQGLSAKSKKRKYQDQDGPSGRRLRASNKREKRRAQTAAVKEPSIVTEPVAQLAQPNLARHEGMYDSPKNDNDSDSRHISTVPAASEDGFQFTRPLKNPETVPDMPNSVKAASTCPPLKKPPRTERAEGTSETSTEHVVTSTATVAAAAEKVVSDVAPAQRPSSPQNASSPEVSITSPNMALTTSNLQLAQQQMTPKLQSPEVAVISVASSSVHSSHILDFSENPLDIVTSTPQDTMPAVDRVAKSEDSSSGSDSSMNSELLEFLSPAASHAGSMDAASPHKVAPVASDDDSSDSSSMKSGEQSSDDSFADEGDASEAEDPEPEVEAQSTTFLETAKSSPVTSQVTDPYPELEADTVDLGQSEDTAEKQRYLPMRPGLRTTYRPLSFLHEQSLREKDDLSKLAQSPSKMSMSQILPDTQDEDPAEDESSTSSSDSSTTDSDDSDNDNNVPAEKRARPVKKNTRKRQSQGARGLLEL